MTNTSNQQPNIILLKTDIDVSKIRKQLDEFKSDWGSQKGLGNTEIQDPHKYITTVDVLQLIMGGLEKPGQYVGDSEICTKSPAYKNHTAVIEYLNQYFSDIRRCGFLALPPNEIVGAHIDEGTYYLDKDRYHLSIQGTYRYFVGNQALNVGPGMLFWFNNKLPHGAANTGDETRITFVFDVPHSPDNLQNQWTKLKS